MTAPKPLEAPRLGECGLCLQSPCTCNDPEPTRETHGISPTCPTCGATIYEGDLDLPDGETTEVDCDRCETTYRVRLVVSRDYYSEPCVRAAKEKK